MREIPPERLARLAVLWYTETIDQRRSGYRRETRRERGKRATGVSQGTAGEVIAARFLREKGYEILIGNYRTRFGEIDIIAQKEEMVAFVEVKTRSEGSLYQPREAVTRDKQQRIIRSALLFLKEYKLACQPRFDVIEIVTKKGEPMTVLELNHLLGAYETGDLHAAF